MNNVATDRGAIPRRDGVVSRALRFRGAQWVRVPNGSEVDFRGGCWTGDAEPGTIAFWVNTTSNRGVVTLIDKRESTSTSLRGYSVFLWNGRLGFQMATGPGDRSCSSARSACSNFIASSLPAVANGNWHFVAVSFSRCDSPTGLFYVDGVAAPFRPRDGAIGNSSALFLGRLAPALGTNYFDGQLDELMYFKHPYTKADLDAIYTDKCQGKCWL